MASRVLIVFPIAALLIGSLACQKIDERPQAQQGELRTQELTAVDSIPAEFGDLVGVVPGIGRGVAILWFQKADKTIVAVPVLRLQQGLHPEVLVIPRR